MPDGSWLDLIPSSERARIRKRLRSPEVYAESREKVKSPEEIGEEMAENERLAELRFAMETEPGVREALKTRIENDLKEMGAEAVLESLSLPPETSAAIEAGEFSVRIEAPSEQEPDQIVLSPEGNVAEKIPVKKSLGNAYVAQFVSGMKHE